MKYLKFFKTEADYNVYVKRGMTIPNISYIKEGDIIKYYYPKLILTYEGKGFAFKKTENMSMIVVDDENVTDTIKLKEEYHFKTSGKHTVEIELSTENISEKMFHYNSSGQVYSSISLNSVIISSSITSIGKSTFEGCTGLTSIIIPNSVTEIGYRTFEGCTGLTSIIIPDSVTEIGYRTFYGCTGLTSIIIPDSVTEIEGNAFSDCTGLTSIIIPNSVTSIGEAAFSGCDGLTSIIIPDSVTEIRDNAFYDCDGLTSIIIPDGVTVIDEGTFYSCTGLTSIIIPDSVTEIRDNAFYDCDGLTSITCNAENAPLISNYVFSNIAYDGKLYVPEGSDYSSWMSHLNKYNWTIQYI